MKLNVKTLRVAFVVIFCFTATTIFGQTIQEKTLFYGEKMTGVNISSFFDVSVIQGDDNYLKLEYDPIFEDQIVAEIKNEILALRLKKGDYRFKKRPILKAIVCVSDLTEVRASGSVDIYFVGKYSPKKITINISGSSDIYGLNCTTENCSLTASGASDVNDFQLVAKETSITVSGSSDLINFNITGDNVKCTLSGASDFEKSVLNISNDFTITASGSSDFEDVKLTCNNAIINLSGASDFVESTVITSNLKLSVSGSSSCNVSGKATNAVVEASGAGSTSLKNVEIDNLEVTLTSASTGSFKVNESLSFEASGGSNLNISGNPRIIKSISTSGASVRYNR